MMTGKQLFEIWASSDSVWAQWISPVLFAQIECREDVSSTEATVPSANWHEGKADSEAAVIIDLPGADSIRLCMALAERGYRPVPVINASPGPIQLASLSPAQPIAVLDMSSLVREICLASRLLPRLALPPDAPPAFILDVLRLKGNNQLREDMFDNRWMVFPQDFPSSRYLTEHKIKRVILVQEGDSQPQEDLSHVLLRWQQAGIDILLKAGAGDRPPSKITVGRPSRFKASWYRALAIMGLKRNSAGGFGSFIPETSAAG